MKFVHMVPVCQNKENVFKSLKKSIFPVQKIYLVLWDNDLQDEINGIEKTLKLVFRVDIIDVCQLDIGDMVNELLQVINHEICSGNMVFLNSTDSPEILNFAFSVSAQISRCKLYTGISTKNRQVIDEVIEIPVEPLRPLEEDKLKIIRILHQEGGELESLDKLIDLFLFELENMKEIDRIRA